jgi:methylmalonyl-CoA mutase cobalamin-binding domain/chain
LVGVDDLGQRYLAAVLDHDRRAAVSILLDDGVAAGVTVPELYLDVIGWSQYVIGQLGHRNLLSVAEERGATAISQLGMSMLRTCMVRSPPIGKHALIACVGGERHELGARMAADFYEMAGFSIRYLGANVGVERLAAAIRAELPDLVGLSITMPGHLAALAPTVDRLRSAAGGQVLLAVGGPAMDRSSELIRTLGVDVYDPDVEEAVQHSVSLLLGRPARPAQVRYSHG